MVLLYAFVLFEGAIDTRSWPNMDWPPCGVIGSWGLERSNHPFGIMTWIIGCWSDKVLLLPFGSVLLPTFWFYPHFHRHIPTLPKNWSKSWLQLVTAGCSGFQFLMRPGSKLFCSNMCCRSRNSFASCTDSWHAGAAGPLSGHSTWGHLWHVIGLKNTSISTIKYNKCRITRGVLLSWGFDIVRCCQDTKMICFYLFLTCFRFVILKYVLMQSPSESCWTGTFDPKLKILKYQADLIRQCGKMAAGHSARWIELEFWVILRFASCLQMLWNIWCVFIPAKGLANKTSCGHVFCTFRCFFVTFGYIWQDFMQQCFSALGLSESARGAVSTQGPWFRSILRAAGEASDKQHSENTKRDERMVWTVWTWTCHDMSQSSHFWRMWNPFVSSPNPDEQVCQVAHVWLLQWHSAATWWELFTGTPTFEVRMSGLKQQKEIHDASPQNLLTFSCSDINSQRSWTGESFKEKIGRRAWNHAIRQHEMSSVGTSESQGWHDKIRGASQNHEDVMQHADCELHN